MSDGNRAQDSVGETTWSERIDREDGVDPDPDERPDAPGGAPEDSDATKAGPADADAMVVDADTEPPDIEESVLADVVDYFEDVDEEFAPAPDEEFVHENFFDLSYREQYEEVERYWVREPFAYVAILYDDEEKDYRYHVVEPTLSEFEQYVRDDIVEDLRDILLHVDPDEGERGELLDDELVQLADRYARRADPGSLHKVRYYIRRDLLGYDKVDPIIQDSRLEDISCDGVDVPIYVYHRDYRDLQTNVSFERERLNSLVVRLAQRSGRHISVADPMVDASLPNGSRVQLTLGEEVSARGSNFTIRQFADVPITPIDLIDWGTFSVETMTYFWLAIENNLSLVFAGGTASGKTTSMNAVSMFIPHRSKVITIEDTREITLPHDNWIQSVTRERFSTTGSKDVNMYQLLQAALRQRPEYLLVGEIRTEPDVALAFFQAMATGHTAYTTMHADSTETVLSRLQNPPLDVPEQMVRELDIVAIQRQIFLGSQRVRRNVRISELGRDAEDGLAKRDIYAWNPAEDVMESREPSGKLREIMHMRGWDETDLEHELERRERLLRTLVEEDISGYEAFTTVVRRYGADADEVMELADAGQLERLF